MIKKEKETTETLFENALVGIFRTSIKEKKVLAVNNTGFRLFGYPSKEEFLKEFNTEKHYVNPKEREQFLKTLRTEGEVHEYTIELLRRDGSHFWAEFSAKIYPEQEELEGVVIDITNRKQIEEALQTSEERFRSITETATDAILSLDECGRVVVWNDAATRMFGYKKGEVMGSVFHDLIVPEPYRAKAWKGWKRFVKTGKGAVIGKTIELTALRKDGSEFPIELSVSSMKQGETWHSTGIIRDITNRKQVEKKTGDYTQQLKAIHDASQTLVISLDFNVVITKCTTLAKELMDADGVVIYLLNPEETHLQPIISNAPHAEKIMSMPLKLGEGVTGEVAVSGKAEIVNRIDRTDRGKQIPGTPLEAESLLSAPLKIHEETIGVMTLNRLGEREFSQNDLTLFDNLANISAAAIQNARLYKQAQKELTDRKRMEAQLLHSQKMEVIGTLGGRIAHEINNRLTSVLGYADLCLLKLKKNDKLYKYIKSIRNNTRNAAGVAQQLVNFGKKQTSRPKEFEPDELIQSLTEIIAQALGRGINLITKLNSDKSIIHADPILVEQIIMNLILNARDVMPEGGELLIETSIQKVNDQFKFDSAIPYGSYLVLKISDTGTGMSREVIERIFEPFFTTKDEAVATGLGLSIVQRIVKENNGFISVTSEEGKGTTFQILFPVLYP